MWLASFLASIFCLLRFCSSRRDPSGIFINQTEDEILIGTTLNCNYTVYKEHYSHHTTSSDIQPNGVSAKKYPYVLVGARSSSFKTGYDIVALGKYDDVFRPTSSVSKAQLGSRHVYWYYYSGFSFGFAPSKEIHLAAADLEVTNCMHRLSWHLDLPQGGYVAGCNRGIREGTWQKVVKYCSDSQSGEKSSLALMRPVYSNHSSILRSGVWNRLAPAVGPAQGPPIRIGTAVTIDGWSRQANAGGALTSAYMLFVEWVNTVRGGVLIAGRRRPLELILVGDESDPAQVSKATEYLIVEENVSLLLGPSGTQLSDLAAAEANASAAVMILPRAPLPKVVENRPRVFGVSLKARENFVTALKSLSLRGARTIGVLKESTFTGPSCSDVPALAAEHGMTVLWHLSFPHGSAADMMHVLGNISHSKPDVVLGCSHEAASRKLVSEMAHHQVSVPAIVFSECFRKSHKLATTEEKELLQYVTCMAPWSSNSTFLSEESKWTTDTFENAFRKAYNSEPKLQAASGWAAATVLLEAVEKSGSDAPDDVARTLRGIEVRSLYGRISFDNEGRNKDSWKALQILPPKGSFDLVAPTKAATRQFVYPMPPWRIRKCFKYPATRKYCAVGMKDGICKKCGIASLASWRPNAWNNVSGCTCESSKCPDGMVLYRGTCLKCPAGEEVDLFGLCQVCAVGRHQNGSQRRCYDCSPGRFANSTGSSACELCELGRAASVGGSAACDVCTGSFYSSQEGSSRCALCQLGRQAETSVGATSCSLCEAGRSSWSGRLCQDCPPGSYQRAVGEAGCIKCPYGSSCTGSGLTWPFNERGWWLFNSSKTEIQLLPCGGDDICLENERCSEGHTGLLCEVCLPGYTKVFASDYCRKCMSRGWQILLGLLFVVVLVIVVYIITGVAVEAAGKPKAISDSLLKLLFNYLTTFNLTTIILFSIVLQKMKREAPVVGGIPEPNPNMINNVLSFGALDWVFFFIPTECIFEPPLAEADQGWVDVLKAARHSDMLRSDFAHAQEKLKDVHWHAALSQMIFWLSAPFLFLFVVLLVGIATICFRIIRQYKFLKQASDFFNAMETQSFQMANQGYARSKVVAFFEAHNRRVLGLYSPVKYVSYMRISCFSFLKNFAYDSQPIAVISMFLLYPTLAQMLLSPLQCREPPEVTQGQVRPLVRMSRAPDVPCYEIGDPLFWLSVFGLVVVTIGVPAFGTCILRRNRRNVGPHFRKTWGFLISGYEADTNFWECLLLVRKSVIVLIAAVNMYNGLRVLLLLMTSIFFSFLHCTFRPFDNRYNQLLDTVESRHLFIWNALCIGIGLVQTEVDNKIQSYNPEEADLTTAWLVSILAAVLHVCFLGFIFEKLVRYGSQGYAEWVVEQEQVLDRVAAGVSDLYQKNDVSSKDESRRQMTIRSVRDKLGDRQGSMFQRGLTLAYDMSYHEGRHAVQIWLFSDWAKRRLDRYFDDKPHLLCDHVNVWFCLAGKKSHSVVNENIRLNKVSQIKMPAEMVLAPTEQDRRFLMDVLMETFEQIVTHPSVNVFSATLLEFVLRVGFTFDEDGRARAVRLREEFEGLDVEEHTMSPMMLHEGSLPSPSKSTISESPPANSKSSVVSMSPPANSKSSAISMSPPLSSKSYSDISSSYRSDWMTRASSFRTSKKSDRIGNTELMRMQTCLEREKNDESTLTHGEEEVRMLVKEMFHPDALMSGIALQELHLNLQLVTLMSEEQLLTWLRCFEEEWAHDVRRRLGLQKKDKQAMRKRVSQLRQSFTGLSGDSNPSSNPTLETGLRRNSANLATSAGSALWKSFEDGQEEKRLRAVEPSAEAHHHEDRAFWGSLYDLGVTDQDEGNRTPSPVKPPKRKANQATKRRPSITSQGPPMDSRDSGITTGIALKLFNQDKHRDEDEDTESSSALSSGAGEENDEDDAASVMSRSTISSDKCASVSSSPDRSSPDQSSPDHSSPDRTSCRTPGCKSKSMQTVPNSGDYRVKPWELRWGDLVFKSRRRKDLAAWAKPSVRSKKKYQDKTRSTRLKIQDLEAAVQSKRMELAKALKVSVEKASHKASLLARDRAILNGTHQALDTQYKQLAELRRLLGMPQLQTHARRRTSQEPSPAEAASMVPLSIFSRSSSRAEVQTKMNTHVDGSKLAATHEGSPPPPPPTGTINWSNSEVPPDFAPDAAAPPRRGSNPSLGLSRRQFGI